ncbi:unnamed protein product [Adineta ricciae]|uniref:F-box domain-containing protein n=1 Tax=Adineta ricciae TaxID=249248 RepID=A0A815T3X6_ADIRI|nr:unnamed protein product [Adineta ricciae]CAF1500280.1 unnamed protein product [Adineta ricciae]
MDEHGVNLLDLPTEILFIILKKLDNLEVLYSLLGVNSQRLDIVVRDQIFTIEFGSMEYIIRTAHYPNLQHLEIFNFKEAILSRHFVDHALFQHSFTQQITCLILNVNEDVETIDRVYTKDVYAIVLSVFKNLKSLTIVAQSSVENCPCLSLYDLPLHTFSSSTLTKLSVNVHDLYDVCALLDGRLKQLTTLTVQIEAIDDSMRIPYNSNDLPNFKCFSLTCYKCFKGFNNPIVPLLQCMKYLEDLSLYLHIYGGSTFISGTCLDNEILVYLPQLHSFTFYIASNNAITNSATRVLHSDIEQTFKNLRHWQVAFMVDYFEPYKMICRVFSLPFKFHLLEHIGNNIPNIIFNSVTHLKLWDKDPFRYEFFCRLTRAFPFLKNLSICNIKPSFLGQRYHLRDKDWCSIVEYPHLISLDIERANISYVEQFLNETKTHLPNLIELKATYMSLEDVTKNFTQDQTRRNCAGVKRLFVDMPMVYKDCVYRYFPSLRV